MTSLHRSAATEASDSFTNLEESIPANQCRRRGNNNGNGSNSSIDKSQLSSSIMRTATSVCPSSKSRNSSVINGDNGRLYQLYQDYRSSVLSLLLCTSFLVILLLQTSPVNEHSNNTDNLTHKKHDHILDDTSDSVLQRNELSLNNNDHNEVLLNHINHLNQGNIYVLGYGSLLNEDSLRRTVGNAKQKDPSFYPVRVKHLVREWTADLYTFRDNHKAQSTAVAVRKVVDPNSYITGVIFQTDMNGIRELIKREIPYNLKEISLSDISFVEKDGSRMDPSRQAELIKLNHISKVYTFVIKPEILNKVKSTPKEKRHPINLTYLDVCLSGSLRQGGMTFAMEFLQTTFGWNSVPLRDNRQSAKTDHVRSEWLKITKHELDIIDSLLKQFLIKPSLIT